MVWTVSSFRVITSCKIIAPVFEEYSKKYSNATFLKVDVDQVPEAAEMAGVRAMPTFQIFVNGQKVTEIVGADKVRLENAISSACA